MKKIGIVGYGLRSDTMMKAFESIEADISISAIADPRKDEIKKTLENRKYFEAVNYYNDIDQMLESERLDGVLIGTRCSLHTDYAIKVLQRSIPLFLEKPVCISEQQLSRLSAAAKGKEDICVVSFPLRLSEITLEMKRIVDSGMLGKITMVQAINNVPYGSVYYHSWYRDEAETGGLFLQKATHDLDYIKFLIGEDIVSVAAKSAKLHFKGDKPAGLKCTDCAEYRTCRESSYVVKNFMYETVQGEYCCFAKDTGNMDCASTIFTTQSGAIISYSQNFVVKKSAARRGARIIGTEGSIEFDFYTGEIREDRYFSPNTVTHKFNFPDGMHFGGDARLAIDFVNVLNGMPAKSSLTDGLKSAALCLAAVKADKEGKFLSVPQL